VAANLSPQPSVRGAEGCGYHPLRQPSRPAPSAQNQVKENEDDHGQQHVTEAHCSWPISFYSQVGRESISLDGRVTL